MSGLSAVSGGLGGGFAGFAGVEFLLFSGLLISVAAGVRGLVARMSSTLLTASLLCALLKVGYEVRGLLSSLVELLCGRRSISGTIISTFFLMLPPLPRSDVVGRGESRSVDRLRCGLLLLPLDLCELRGLSRELFESRSFSTSPRSRSLSFLRRRLGLGSSSIMLLGEGSGNPRGFGQTSNIGMVTAPAPNGRLCVVRR